MKDSIYSFRVIAVNEGGRSFPSEILSICRRSDQKGEVLIVNGFTRVSAPFSFTTSEDSIAGFSGSGGQWRCLIWPITILSGRCTNSGASSPGWTTMPGLRRQPCELRNHDHRRHTRFDYPFYTGRLLRLQDILCFRGADAVESGTWSLTDYITVDWILGKQREWSMAGEQNRRNTKLLSKKKQQANHRLLQWRWEISS